MDESLTVLAHSLSCLSYRKHDDEYVCSWMQITTTVADENCYLYMSGNHERVGVFL